MIGTRARWPPHWRTRTRENSTSRQSPAGGTSRRPTAHRLAADAAASGRRSGRRARPPDRIDLGYHRVRRLVSGGVEETETTCLGNCKPPAPPWTRHRPSARRRSETQVRARRTPVNLFAPKACQRRGACLSADDTLLCVPLYAAGRALVPMSERAELLRRTSAAAGRCPRAPPGRNLGSPLGALRNASPVLMTRWCGVLVQCDRMRVEPRVPEDCLDEACRTADASPVVAKRGDQPRAIERKHQLG